MTEPLRIAQVGEPVLREPARPVSDFGSEALRSFIDQLLGAMIAAGGVGIAAPQVFNSSQVMIIASRPNPRYPDAPEMEPLVLINPVIESFHGERVGDWEGCLSVPGIRGYVQRYDSVDIRYQDCNGDHHRVTFNGFVARIFQHEYDHLVGKTFVERVEDNRHLVAESVLPGILNGEIPFTP